MLLILYKHNLIRSTYASYVRSLVASPILRFRLEIFMNGNGHKALIVSRIHLMSCIELICVITLIVHSDCMIQTLPIITGYGNRVVSSEIRTRPVGLIGQNTLI